MTSQIPTRPALRTATPPAAIALLTLLAVVAVWVCILVEPLRWVWGVLFSTWALATMRSGETFLIGRLRRDDQPVLFWFVCLNWFVIGILWALYP